MPTANQSTNIKSTQINKQTNKHIKRQTNQTKRNKKTNKQTNKQTNKLHQTATFITRCIETGKRQIMRSNSAHSSAHSSARGRIALRTVRRGPCENARDGWRTALLRRPALEAPGWGRGKPEDRHEFTLSSTFRVKDHFLAI